MKILKNKKILIGAVTMIVVAITITILSLTLSKSDDNVVLSDNENNKNFINNSFLTLMLEQSDGTYQESTTNTWPSGNYAFNSELSRCENGGELSWDRENGIVELLSNKSDACYVYFDLYNVVTITNVSATKTTNSVTLTVTVDAGENPVATYYFSMDGGNSYQTSNTNTYTFSNLNYGTSYTFQVYVVDSEGYESNEETIEVTTENYVNPVVNSVTATNVTNDSITVSVSASAGTNAIGTYYYSINNGSYTSSSSNSHTFSGLSAGTNYSIKVYVKDTNGVDSNVYTINAETENVVYLANVCNNGNNLASCITSFYNTYGADATKIYYHNSSLANGAGDNSYRYAGASEEVNNYICFGSTASTCPSDNLYRIIGVFENQVKLIKATSYGRYVWDSGDSNTWNSSTKPDIRNTLNSTFLRTLSSTWKNKIASHSYKVGGIYENDSVDGHRGNAKNYYDYEVGSSSSNTTDNMKIGLVYVSDFLYAVDSKYWTEDILEYKNFSAYNWMFYESSEWTISRITFSVFDDGNRAFIASAPGQLSFYQQVTDSYNIRPSFYLTSSTQYVSGSGTQSDPIRIN